MNKLEKQIKDLTNRIEILEKRLGCNIQKKYTELPADELYPRAQEIVIKTGKASASYLQRMLNIGYSRATRLIDRLEDEKVIGKQIGSKPRPVLIEDWGL